MQMATSDKSGNQTGAGDSSEMVEIQSGVSGLRGVQVALLQMAYALARQPKRRGVLVLTHASVGLQRLRDEWQRVASVLRPEVLKRLTICVDQGERLVGIPRDPDAETQRILSKAVATERGPKDSRTSRGDAPFVVLKILLHHWLTDGQPVTTDWLAKTTGYSYPTVAKALRGLGSLLERQSDRRVRLRWFPHDQLARLLAVSDRVRETVRFADRSIQPRPPEAHLRRLEKLNPPRLAIGGSLGAAHYFPGIDLVGVPRLDLSQHGPGRHPDLGFIEKLDPALKRVLDPLEPATVVVHQVRHAKPLFEPRKGGLQWADPVECLLDLHEAGLSAQTSQFLKALEKKRPTTT
jgi:hypothetical protein